MATKKFTDANGNIIRVTGNPKSGGEGDVYNVEGNPNLVVKVYNDKKRSNKQAYKTLIKKIQAMCDICDDTIMGRAGWPQQIVYSNNQPVGFTMNKIKHCNTLHQLTDTLDRKEKFLDNNWKYSILVAYNLAIAVHTLHSKGVVIGDINESNFLIGNRTIAEQQGITDFESNGIVYCIDCDSFQILTEKENFLCTVNKAEYLPPELKGADLHTIIRTQNQDNFGLAVLIFQLIMLGKHPYMGVGTPGNVTEAINGGYFVFGKNAERNQVYPPMPSELYSSIYFSLNDEIRSLFEQAFKPQHEIILNGLNSFFEQPFGDGFDITMKRPTAEDWVNALKRQMEELVQCSNPAHYYDKSGDCIWCKIQNEFGYNPWENKVKPIKINNSYVPTTKKTNNKPKKTNKPVKQKTQQVTPTQNVQTVNTASLNPTSQNIILVNDTYFYRKYQGTIVGKLYLYANALHFESGKYEAEQLSKTIYFDDIANIEKDGSLLMPAIIIKYNDGTMDSFTLFNRAIWIPKLYATLIQGGYQLAQTSSAFDNINRQYNESSDPDSKMEYFMDAPKWWTDQDWVKEGHWYNVELMKGNLTAIPDMIKWVFKGIFKFIVKPLIVTLIIGLIAGIDFDTSDNFLLFMMILGVIFEGIPKTWLNQPKKSIIFLILAAIFLGLYGLFDSKNKTNNIKTPVIEQTKTEEQVYNNKDNDSNQENLAYRPSVIKPNDNKNLANTQSDVEENTNKAANTISETDFEPYMREMERRIKMNWNPPIGNNSTFVKVKFKIAKDGRLLSYEITQSSGMTSTDRAAVEALLLTAPFRPLPSKFKGESIDIEFTFDFKRIAS